MGVPPLLKCYLGKQGDTANVMLLFLDKLVVIFRGQSIEFSFDQIRGMVIGRKKLIIPLVMGGIGTCLSWMSLQLGWYHYYTNLTLVFLFFGWMYYGFMGSDALEIHEKKHTHVFLIKVNHFVLNSFLKFVKSWMLSVQTQPSTAIVYHLAHKSEWEDQLLSDSYKPASFSQNQVVHCSQANLLNQVYSQHFEGKDAVLIGIDLLRLDTPSIDPTGLMSQDYPRLNQPINKSAIVQLQFLTSAELV